MTFLHAALCFLKKSGNQLEKATRSTVRKCIW